MSIRFSIARKYNRSQNPREFLQDCYIQHIFHTFFHFLIYGISEQVIHCTLSISNILKESLAYRIETKNHA